MKSPIMAVFVGPGYNVYYFGRKYREANKFLTAVSDKGKRCTLEYDGLLKNLSRVKVWKENSRAS